ncbi:tetratricopeptide repeat protein [Candidatus Poribacteria bacterium]|jgi:Flp pilus assembly protein TadD|nr:tetratricopeptide repeat protein [Candidatus Poribacteria bacterium]MBT5532295.1 tetratricopeptide repeat protein [Candidatus Poribacteria bacterium]MBT5715113.1 tetratricopeptide repeat protein [Candidatus Poribacteria bacterium]MBT7809515.1 tetratricopeptide repeat protein [Candidatus Poribacteria bacterium]
MAEEMDVLLERGQAAFDARDYEQAGSLFKEVLDAEPGDSEARLGYVRCLNEQGDSDAVKALLEPTQDEIEDGRLLAELARAYYADERFEDSVAVFATASGKAPDDGHIRANHGFALWQKGDHTQALDTLKEALPLVQDDALLSANMGQIYLQLGMWNEAVSSIERYLIDFPNDLRLRTVLAFALDKAGWREEAETVLDEVLTIDPEHAEAKAQLAALGEGAEEAESPGPGAPDVETPVVGGEFGLGIPDAPSPIDSLDLGGISAFGGSAPADSTVGLPDFGAITVVDDTDPAKQAAEDLLTRVTEILDESDVPAGIAYLESERGTSDHPAEVLNLLGKLLTEDDDYEGALEAFREAIEVDPFHAQAQSNLGVLLWQMGEFEEATETLRQAIELDTEDMDGRINLALICHQVGLYEDAVPLYTQYLDQFPENTEIRMELATCFVELEEMDAAIREVDTVLLLEPDNEAAQKRMDELSAGTT